MSVIKNEMALNVPFEDYCKLDAINASAIKEGRKSMLHMHHYLNGPERAATDAMIKGSHVHGIILEPDTHLDDIVVWDGDKRKAGWKEFKAEHGERNIVTPSQMAEYKAIKEAVYANNHARQLLEACKTEVTFTWLNKKYGAGKCRADGYSEKHGLIELKTTRNIEVHRFIQDAYNMGYHTAAGWYYNGINKVLNGACQAVNMIVVESSPPYDCYVMPMPFPIIQRGIEESIEIATKYYTHKLVGNFPGVTYGASIEYHLPSRAENNDTIDMTGV